MGYYSDVTISMYKKDFVELCQIARLDGVHDALHYIILHVSESDIVEDDHNRDLSIITLTWYGIKWYGDGVDMLTDFLHNGRVFSLIRIGEDTDDNEYDSDESYELSGLVQIDRQFYRESYGRSFTIDDELDPWVLEVDGNAVGEAIESNISYDDMLNATSGEAGR